MVASDKRSSLLFPGVKITMKWSLYHLTQLVQESDELLVESGESDHVQES